MLISFLIVIYHAPTLARFVKAIRYKDFEVTMREDFNEARLDAEQVKLEIGDAEPINLNPNDKIIQLAKIDRGIAIVEIWKNLEVEITRLIQHNGLMRYTNPFKFVEHLAEVGKITSRDLSLFRNLRKIRNESVHSHNSSELTMAEVLEFRDFVEVLAKRFESIKSEPGYIEVPPKL
mgnify:CR=1 FL=1